MINVSTTVVNNIPMQLDDIEKDVWLLLLNGSLRAKAPFHTGTLATQANAGINLRTVVLRKVLPDEKLLFCHTDVRSAKYAQLQANPQVSWLFYDEPKRLQIRLSGNATLHNADNIADSHWADTNLSSRKCYLTQSPPGTIQDFPTDDLPMYLQGRVIPGAEESEKGRENFGVIRSEIHFIDWLFLSSEGHRRCQFQYKQGSLENKNWVNP